MLLYRVTCTTHIILTDHPKQPEVRHNLYNHYATQIIFEAHFTLQISSLPEELVHVVNRKF